MKLFHVMVCLALLCSAKAAYAGPQDVPIRDPDVLPDQVITEEMRKLPHGEHKLWRLDCTSFNQFLGADAIFVGKAVERRLMLNDERNSISNACWVRFKVESVLRGSIKDKREIWTQATYDALGMPLEDKDTYKYCYFEPGGRYLVMGRYGAGGYTNAKGDKVPSEKWPEYVIVAQDVRPEPPHLTCPIIKRLSATEDGVAWFEQFKKEKGWKNELLYRH